MGWLVISVPLSSGLFVVVVDGEEMTNACIVLGRGGDGSEVELVVMMALL